MKITEVRIKLMSDPDDRLRAFCSITFDDCFVVRDLKIIDGTTGPFVAMPSRKLTSHCGKCGCKNYLRANYCNQCGAKQNSSKNAGMSDNGRAKLYADIAHPINSECRDMIQQSVIRAYDKEKKLAAEPGYESRYDDFLDYDDSDKPKKKLPASSDKKTDRQRRTDRPNDPDVNQRDKTSPVDRVADDTTGADFGAGVFQKRD